MANPRNVYRPSPAGRAVHPWINKADTKFNEDGVYKTGLVVSGEEAQAFKATIDAAAQAAFDDETSEMTPAERKKWSVYVPYEVAETDEGAPTGDIRFSFKQNAVLKVEGAPKPIQIALFDANDRPTQAAIYGGAKLRVMYRPRPVKMAAAKQAGVRLDFLKVQVIELADRNAEGGFGSVEGGYSGEDEGEGRGFASHTAGGGDY